MKKMVMESTHQSENDYRIKLSYFLKEVFEIETEVFSQCKTKRIDMILRCKADPRIVFGVELKKVGKKRGHGLSDYVKQAINYSNLSWPIDTDRTEFKRIPIVISPALSHNYWLMPEGEPIKKNNQLYYADRHKHSNKHHTANGFLGGFGIGELRRFEGRCGLYYSIIFNNKEIFNTENCIWNGQRITPYLNYEAYLNLTER